MHKGLGLSRSGDSGSLTPMHGQAFPFCIAEAWPGMNLQQGYVAVSPQLCSALCPGRVNNLMEVRVFFYFLHVPASLQWKLVR